MEGVRYIHRLHKVSICVCSKYLSSWATMQLKLIRAVSPPLQWSSWSLPFPYVVWGGLLANNRRARGSSFQVNATIVPKSVMTAVANILMSRTNCWKRNLAFIVTNALLVSQDTCIRRCQKMECPAMYRTNRTTDTPLQSSLTTKRRCGQKRQNRTARGLRMQRKGSQQLARSQSPRRQQLVGAGERVSLVGMDHTLLSCGHNSNFLAPLWRPV